MRDFTLHQLRTFMCAARAGSFSDAAAELGISQPAVSDQIALLEERLGQRLFVRRIGTTPKLTPDGLKLLETAGTLLDTSKAMCRQDSQERVRLCTGPWLRDVYFRPILPQLFREHPDVSIELVPPIPRLDVRAALERGQVDLVMYSLGQLPDGWPNARVVCDVTTVMVGPRDIRRKLETGEEKIEDLQFILPSTGNFLENWLERQLQRLGIKCTKPFIYLEFTDVIQKMVEGGLGVTMLMYDQLAEAIAAGRLEIFGPRLPPMQRVIARSLSAPRSARAIADRLVEVMSGPPPAMPAM